MDTLFLAFHTRNLGTKTRQLENPFTGQSITAYIDEGMTPGETRASAALLANAGASEADPEGFRKVRFSGGNYAYINLGASGAEIEVCDGVTPDAVEFIFQLALAAGMLVTSTIDPDVIAVLPGERHPDIATRWPNAASISSAENLMAWIRLEVSTGRIAQERDSRFTFPPISNVEPLPWNTMHA